MIENLTVENYRSFQSYSMQGLKRVNLLTGFNNSGKSSLLEAIEVLASAGEPKHFLDISKRRDEYVYLDKSSHQVFADPSQFFHGRDYGLKISVRSTDWRVSVEVNPSDTEEGYDEGDTLVISREGRHFGSPRIMVPFGERGAFGSSDRRTRWGGSISSYETFCPVEYLGIREMGGGKLAALWDQVLISKSENEPATSLQILDEEIESVAYLSSGLHQGRMHVGMKGEKSRTPIGSHGEGTQRLLTLAIMLTTVKGGILLVDEIDTGLHYSILADMWKLVIGTAIKNDIQVFATTHSLDCLRGLNEACQANPEYAQEISLQTIDRNLLQSIDTDAEGLAASLSIGIEVR